MNAVEYSSRPYAGEEDLQPICDLINHCHAVDRFVEEPVATVENWRRRISAPGCDPERDLRLWHWPDGRLAAFALLSTPPPDAQSGEEFGAWLYLRVHPDARDQGIEDEVMLGVAPMVRDLAGSRSRPRWLRTGMMDTTPEYVAYRRGMLERNGFRPVRYEFRMHRSLAEPSPELRFPPGYTLRTVTAADEEAWIDAFNQSFVDHWDFEPVTAQRYRQWNKDASYDPAGDLIAVTEDGTIAAFCRCLINRNDNALQGTAGGWIDMLGTRRGHRGIGLGRAMLLAGMRWLKSQGMRDAILAVDAQNPTGALRLYESVGFAPSLTTYTYQKDL